MTSPILQADIFANIQKKGQNRHCSPPFPCLTNSVSKNCQGRPNHFDILFASLEKEYHDVLSHELYEFFPRINISNGLRELKLPLKLKSSLELLEANLIKSCL